MADDWRQSVMDAVDRDDGAQLQHLLKSTKQTLDYRIGILSPLTKAACRNRLSNNCSLIEQLLLAGADVNYPTVSGETPLMLAALLGNTRLSELLLKQGANVNARIHSGGIPMSVLCCSIMFPCEIQLVALLLEHGAQIYDPSKESPNHYYSVRETVCPPVCTAISSKSPNILKMFLDHSDIINVRLPIAGLFSYCISEKSEECAIMSLQQGYYPHPKDVISFFKWVAKSGLPINLMSLLVEINPHCLQNEWLIS